MPNSSKAVELAAELGLTVDQVEGVLAFARENPVTVYDDGVVSGRTVYSADRIAQRRAELAAERGQA
jgi:hypothetical protein